MSWNEEAARHLRAARLALIGEGVPESEHDRTLAAYNDLMAYCHRHDLVAAEADAPRPALRRVA